MKPKQYFDKVYDKDHIEQIIEMNDLVSLHDLIEGFKKRNHPK